MKSFYLKLIPFILLFFILSCNNSDNDCETDTLVTNENVTVYEEGIYKGYSLISPLQSKNTYLINNEGYIVKKWESEYKSIMAYLTEDGSLIRNRVLIDDHGFNAGGATGGLEMFDFNGNLIWSWNYASNDYILHHDFKILNNGNILATVWDLKSQSEAINKGRNPSLLFENKIWASRIIEIEPIGNNDVNIVWQWSIWDHLVQDYDNTKEGFNTIAEHPELININYTTGDANLDHNNSLEYIEEYDQILLSINRFNEFWIIDHSTTTSQAGSHFGGNSNKGGDLLYRWGNSAAYNTGDSSNQKLFGQHDVTWVQSKQNHGGNVMLFNNNRFSNVSPIDEIQIPISNDGFYNLMPNTMNEPSDFIWSYINPDIFGSRVSGAKRLPNGNTLITSGIDAKLFEINFEGDVVWNYNLPFESMIFKVEKYSENFSAFDNQTLEALENQIID